MAVQLVQSMSFLCRSKSEPIISVQLTDDTELAVSADGKKNWLVGVQTQMDDETSLKVRLGVKEDAGKEISCFLSRKLRPDFTITVTSAIQSKKLTDLNAHRLVRKWVTRGVGSGVGCFCFRVCVFGRSALVMAVVQVNFSFAVQTYPSDSHELTARTHPRIHRKHAHKSTTNTLLGVHAFFLFTGLVFKRSTSLSEGINRRGKRAEASTISPHLCAHGGDTRLRSFLPEHLLGREAQLCCRWCMVVVEELIQNCTCSRRDSERDWTNTLSRVAGSNSSKQEEKEESAGREARSKESCMSGDACRCAT